MTEKFIPFEKEIHSKSLEKFDELTEFLFDAEEMYENTDILAICEACLKVVIACETMFSDQGDYMSQQMIRNGLQGSLDMIQSQEENFTSKDPNKLN